MPRVFAAFALSLIVTAALTPLVGAAARSCSIVAHPRNDRWHTRPTALLGGVAIWAGAIISIVAIGGVFSSGAEQIVPGILVAATSLFVVGLADDFRRLTPPVKLLFQTLAAAIVIGSGVVYSPTSSASGNVVFTIFWIIAITNSLNLLDNIDGVAAGVAGIAAIFLAINFTLTGAPGLAVISASLAGAAFGFLPFNFAPASIFMGDSGSLFMGIVLASLCAAWPAHSTRMVVPVFVVPVLTVVVPIVDTLLVTVLRTLAGRPAFLGGRDHTTHRLVAMGLSVREVALLFYAAAAIGGGLGLWMARDKNDGAGLLAALFLAALAVIVRFLARMHRYDEAEAQPSSRATLIVSDLLHKRRSAEMLIDMLLFAVAYRIAFDGFGANVPRAAGTPGFLALVVFTKIAALSWAGAYRSIWDRGLLSELRTVGGALLPVSTASCAVAALLAGTSSIVRMSIVDLVIGICLVAAARGLYHAMELAHRVLRVARPLVTSMQQ